jgi:LmbE family N-acetylglucosaminyl deacetylase
VSDPFRMMAVLAHPDDESLGCGGTLARYAGEGVDTFLVTATRGENGRHGSTRGASPLQLGRIREAELLAAAKVLGLSEVRFLDYVDGAVDRVDPDQAIRQIAFHIRRVRPDVVMTFGPDGAYGHPDHIAISQLTTSALVYAAQSGGPHRNGEQHPPHVVSKLYYMAWTSRKWSAYQAALKKLTSTVDGIERQATPWPEWAVTTVIDTSIYSPIVWRAVSCHESQMSVYQNLQNLAPEQHKALWGTQEFYRAFSLVNGGRQVETDLFEGLRGTRAAKESIDDAGECSGAAPGAESSDRVTAGRIP